MENFSSSSASDLNWKYVAYTAGVALVVVLLYHYVFTDYLPEKD